MGEDSQFNLTIEAFDADNSDCVSGCIMCDNPEGISVEPFDTTLNALAGINRTIEASGILDSLTLSLDFNPLNSTSSWAGDMALVLCAPDGQCIQIGGYNYYSGHPSAGSWPGNWNVSTSNTYSTGITGLGELGLSGEGAWTLSVINGWTTSGPVQYGVELQLFGLCPLVPVEVNSLPVSASGLGRTVVINDIVINGVNQNEAHVEAGSEVALTMTGSLTNNNTSCPGCFTQSYARINGVMNLCLANTGGNASINASTTFTAPTEPGVYYLNPSWSWQYNCVNSTSTSENFSSGTFATFVVSAATSNPDGGAEEAEAPTLLIAHDFVDPDFDGTPNSYSLDASNTGWTGTNKMKLTSGGSTPDGDGYYTRNWAGSSSAHHAETKLGEFPISASERGSLSFSCDWATNVHAGYGGARFIVESTTSGTPVLISDKHLERTEI